MITETQIKAALRNAPTSGKKSIELKDDGERGAGRLALLIRPFKDRVTAEWYAVYYRDGKRAMTKISTYPTLSLADARKLFREKYAPAISTGEAVAGAHVRKKAGETGNGVSVTELFRAYVDDLERAGKRSAKEAERILLSEKTGGVAKALGAKRPALEITAADVVPILSEIYERGSVVMAHTTRTYMRAAFAFGMKAAHDYTRKKSGANWGIKANPVQAIPADVTAHRARDRFLSPAEFRAFWTWLEGRDKSSTFAPVLRLMLATGQRVEEIIRIGFESSYDKSQRMLNWDKTKNNRPHSIPLPPQAVAILDGLAPNSNGLYFPRRGNGAKPGSYYGTKGLVGKYIRETGAASFVPKDIRRTWKTLTGMAGLSREIRDRLQNHARSDVASKHYDKWHALPEKRAAMAEWGKFLDRILSGELDEQPTAAVIQMTKAA